MVIDAFPFSYELDLLEIRLNTLKDIPGIRHVLIESEQAFSGRPKPLWFRDSRDRFQEFPIRALSVKIDPQPEEGLTPEEQHAKDAWAREFGTRRALGQYIAQMGVPDGTPIMLSDVDEIPKPEAVERCIDFLQEHDTIVTMQQTMYYYWLDCRLRDPWAGTQMWRWDNSRTDLQVIRNHRGHEAMPTLSNAGWHFSYVGGKQHIIDKLHGGGHTEFDKPEFTNEEHVERCMAEGLDLFGRDNPMEFICIDETTHPRYVFDNLPKYAHLVSPDGFKRWTDELLLDEVSCR